MTFAVRQGGQEDQRAALRQGTLTIFLNGGSQTRRDVREDWREVARAHNLGYEATGFWVRLTGIFDQGGTQ